MTTLLLDTIDQLWCEFGRLMVQSDALAQISRRPRRTRRTRRMRCIRRYNKMRAFLLVLPTSVSI